MRNPRLDQLAAILVQYSTRIQPGELVRIQGDPVGMPLLEAIYRQVIEAGGHPIFRCVPDALQNIFLDHANDEQLAYLSPITEFEVSKIDASISLWAPSNTRAMTNVDPARLAAMSAARKPINKVFYTRASAGELKWVGTQYPTNASAQDAEMSLAEYEDFVFNAGKLNLNDPVAAWTQLREQQQRMVDFLNKGKQIRFEADSGTDVTVNIEQMQWINCWGECNFPDGEVFTGPNLKAQDGGVNGTVCYSFPAVYRGREVPDIQLRFEKGKVVEARASKNEDYLIQMLDQDEGARYVGEVALGTNYGITRYTKNTLFDEKIGGTFHLAVGNGYPETGNTNESGLHWDMVCDLRPGGRVTVDGKIISENGQFTIDGWPGTNA